MKYLDVLALFTAGAALTGCSSDDETPPPDGGNDGPAYLVHSAVETNQERLNYFSIVDSLAEPVQLDYGRSLELPGRARLYAQPGVGFFAIGDSETLAITRYDLAADGTLVADRSISLQHYGVTSLGAQSVLFVSPTKAYYKDTSQAQIIVWNPTAMRVDKTIELPAELLIENWLLGFSDWVHRDGSAYVTVSWYSPEYDRVRPGTALVRIDEATDAITVTQDDRCRGIATAAQVGDDLYFFSDVINAFGHAVYPDDAGQADCALRIASGATTFDAGYVGSMASALGANAAGTVVSVTASGEAWVQVADLNVTPTAPGTTYGEWYGGGWSWVHMPVTTFADPVRVPGEAGAYSGFTLADDERFFVSQTKADYSETTLIDLNGAAPTPGLTFAGFGLDIAKLR